MKTKEIAEHNRKIINEAINKTLQLTDKDMIDGYKVKYKDGVAFMEPVYRDLV